MLFHFEQLISIALVFLYFLNIILMPFSVTMFYKKIENEMEIDKINVK